MHINWAEFWVIVAFMFLCIQIGRLDERRLRNKKTKKLQENPLGHYWICDHPECVFAVESLDSAEVSRVAFLHRYTKNYGGHGA